MTFSERIFLALLPMRGVYTSDRELDAHVVKHIAEDALKMEAIFNQVQEELEKKFEADKQAKRAEHQKKVREEAEKNLLDRQLTEMAHYEALYKAATKNGITYDMSVKLVDGKALFLCWVPIFNGRPGAMCVMLIPAGSTSFFDCRLYFPGGGGPEVWSRHVANAVNKTEMLPGFIKGIGRDELDNFWFDCIKL